MDRSWTKSPFFEGDLRSSVRVPPAFSCSVLFFVLHAYGREHGGREVIELGFGRRGRFSHLCSMSPWHQT